MDNLQIEGHEPSLRSWITYLNNTYVWGKPVYMVNDQITPRMIEMLLHEHGFIVRRGEK